MTQCELCPYEDTNQCTKCRFNGGENNDQKLYQTGRLPGVDEGNPQRIN